MGLVAGVLVLNLAFAAVGFALLSPALRGGRLRVWFSFTGIALLIGIGVVCVALCIEAVAGERTGPWAFAVTACVAAAAGLGGAVLLPATIRRSLAPTQAETRENGRRDVLATAAAVALAVVLGAAVVGGFRTSPWLDDSWFMWLAKGIALDRHGLDLRLFTPTPHGIPFTSPGYPWVWSVLTNLDVRAAGAVDLRAMNAQLALLLLAFVGAAARLFWGRLRPSVLWPGLLLLVIAPELLRQTQSGGADVPLALFLGAFTLVAVNWLRDGRPLELGLAFVFAAAAVQIKDEGLPQLVIVLAVASVFLGPAAGLRRTGRLWTVCAAAVVTAVPWLAWRSEHGVPSEVSLGDGLHRLRALDARDRLHASASTLVHDALAPRQWLVLIPLVLVLAPAVSLLTRRLLPLALVAFLGLELAFWIWVYWSTTGDLQYRLTTSAYRVVVTPIVLSALAVPALAQAFVDSLGLRLRGRTDRRETAPAQRPVELDVHPRA